MRAAHVAFAATLLATAIVFAGCAAKIFPHPAIVEETADSAELGVIRPDLSDALGKVEAAGGKVTVPKTQITEEVGFMAFFIDTERNRMALHSQA